MNQETNETNASNAGAVGSPDAEPMPKELGAGSVNFDANVVSDAAAASAAATEAGPATEAPTLGNVRAVGTTESAPTVTLKSNEPVTKIHTIGVSINVTLNTGLTLLAGRKGLKNIEIERDGESEKYNFYNPFVRSDKEKHTGEGLLRHTLGSIAKVAHTVLGREAVYLGTEGSVGDAIANLVSSVHNTIEGYFPLSPNDAVFDADVELRDGTNVIRPVLFGELFTIKSWVTSESDDDCLVNHIANFNILLNVGAVYDSSEPHTFVRRAVTFVEAQLKAQGLTDLVDYSVNYAFDSATLVDPSVRDTLEILISEDGYDVVSKAGIAMGKYDWIPTSCPDCLFGFGCDVALRSPGAQAVTEGEAE